MAMRTNRTDPSSHAHSRSSQHVAASHGGDGDLRGFCAAPWTEGVLKQSGAFQVCCRNGRSFGSWIDDGLEACWHSEELQAFRRQIVEGRFPDEACRNCHANGTARTLGADLISPFSKHSTALVRHVGRAVPEVAALVPLLSLRRADGHAMAVLGQYSLDVRTLRARAPLPPEGATAVEKLDVIGRITRSFLLGDLKPPEVAPYRQVALSDRCNARCIQCPGLYYGNLATGEVLPDEHLDAAFARSDSMVDFFMNGAEFLLYPGWKTVARRLADQGVQLSISTNGILLTPANVAYLIDHRLARSINVSIDGAVKETVEAIRVNVKFDRLCAAIAHLIAYADERSDGLALSFSFVLMRRNHREFPEMVRLIHRLRAGRLKPGIGIYCQALEAYDAPGYNDFVAREHHAVVPHEELVATFRETLAASRETGLPVNAFYSFPLTKFVADGCPVPPLPSHLSQGAPTRAMG
jgi:hypothetical protein